MNKSTVFLSTALCLISLSAVAGSPAVMTVTQQNNVCKGINGNLRQVRLWFTPLLTPAIRSAPSKRPRLYQAMCTCLPEKACKCIREATAVPSGF